MVGHSGGLWFCLVFFFLLPWCLKNEKLLRYQRVKGKTVVRPAIMYGLSLSKRQDMELEVTEMKMLRLEE